MTTISRKKDSPPPKPDPTKPLEKPLDLPPRRLYVSDSQLELSQSPGDVAVERQSVSEGAFNPANFVACTMNHIRKQPLSFPYNIDTSTKSAPRQYTYAKGGHRPVLQLPQPATPPEDPEESVLSPRGEYEKERERQAKLDQQRAQDRHTDANRERKRDRQRE